MQAFSIVGTMAIQTLNLALQMGSYLSIRKEETESFNSQIIGKNTYFQFLPGDILTLLPLKYSPKKSGEPGHLTEQHIDPLLLVMMC